MKILNDKKKEIIKNPENDYKIIKEFFDKVSLSTTIEEKRKLKINAIDSFIELSNKYNVIFVDLEPYEEDKYSHYYDLYEEIKNDYILDKDNFFDEFFI